MRGYRVEGSSGLDALRSVELPDPICGPGEVVVEMRAASLNYRDLGILRGGYARNDTNPVVPLSDGAGVVVEVDEGVGEWAVGDRVHGLFVQDWIDGPPNDAVLRTSLGGGIDGVLRERMTFPVSGLVRTPEHWSDAEAACVPCAAVTAYHALFGYRGLTADDTVLLLGTGGVSMFALQMATAIGARVIQTSSSDEKLALARTHGAADTVNYRTTPEWAAEVRRLTDGRGVDFVVEVGGPGTLGQSMQAVAVGGQISLIGVLDDPRAAVNPLPVMFDVARIQGIYVGSRKMHEACVDLLTTHDHRPVIDRTFAFDEARDAYAHLKSQQHVGKVVISFS